MSLETRDTETDVLVAVEGLGWVQGVYAFEPDGVARTSSDALTFGILLSPYGMSQLVQAHYAIVQATGGRAIAGRVLYADAASALPAPFRRARRLALRPGEREAAQKRIAARPVETETDLALGRVTQRDALEAELRRLLARRRPQPAPGPTGRPRVLDERPLAPRERPLNECTQEELSLVVDRAFDGISILWSFGDATLDVGIFETAEPPAAIPRILVIDDDAATARALEASDCVVTVAEDVWRALDLLSDPACPAFDLILCALALGTHTGAQICRVATKSRPELVDKFVFLASDSTVAKAAESARGKVLARPVTSAAVHALLAERSAVRG